MNGNTKRTAFLILALALPLLSAQARQAPAAAAQDPDGVDVLRGFSVELAAFMKDDWCGLDRPALRLRWAEFGIEFGHLLRSPAVRDGTFHEFFRSSLDPDVVEHNPIFFKSFGEMLEFVKQLPREDGFADPSWILSQAANSYQTDILSTEYARWMILLAARAGGFGESRDPDYVQREESFRRDFPRPEGMSAVCGEALTQAIEDVSPLRLGAAAVLVFMSIALEQ